MKHYVFTLTLEGSVVIPANSKEEAEKTMKEITQDGDTSRLEDYKLQSEITRVSYDSSIEEEN